MLSNIYAHYSLDVWFEDVVSQSCRGVRLVRYADDFVICCPDKQSADRIYEVLPKRLKKFKLELHETKTKLVSMDKRKHKEGERQGTFSFLGFTYILATSRKGTVIPKVKTDRKKFRKKLKSIKEWVKARRSESFNETWQLLNVKLVGYARYYGVSHNSHNVARFIDLSKRLFFKWMNLRSQKRSMTLEQFQKYQKVFPGATARVYVSLFPEYVQRMI